MLTLYLADLDGTLLSPAQTVSERTRETLNALLKKGAHISYATARSLETSSAVTRGIRFSDPVILHNGAVVSDPVQKKPLFVARFSEAEKQEILAAFLTNGLFPVTYSFLAGKNRFSYFWERSGEAQRAFIATRTGSAAGSERARELFSADGILDGDVFYFACLGEKHGGRAAGKEAGFFFCGCGYCYPGKGGAPLKGDYCPGGHGGLSGGGEPHQRRA